MKVTRSRAKIIIRKKDTTEILVIDGIKMQLEAADVDGDGTTGGVEKIKQQFDQGIQPVLQPSELGDSLKELHNDDLDPNSRMSGIDMRANLHHIEVQSVLALDALVGLGVLPTKVLAFSRQKKRLSKSLGGMGSKQIVELVGGKREQDSKNAFGNMMDKGKNFMGLNR